MPGARTPQAPPPLGRALGRGPWRRPPTALSEESPARVVGGGKWWAGATPVGEHEDPAQAVLAGGCRGAQGVA